MDVKKATGPNDVSPQVLWNCASDLAGSFSEVFTPRVAENTCVVPVRKKNSRSDPVNYRPISLLFVVGKVLERIVADAKSSHLDENALLSDQQFPFRSGRSASDLLMLLSRDWQDFLDYGLDTLVTAGAFDRVRHAGLLDKLRVKDIQGHFMLIEPSRRTSTSSAQYGP